MTTITNTTKEFKRMFKMIMCGNKYPLFEEIILEINEDSIFINAMDKTRAVGTNQEYTGFHIEGDTDIPIDTVSIYDAISLFDDNTEIELIYEDNKIILKTNSQSKKDTITIPTLKLDEINNKSQIKFTDNSLIINGNEITFDANVIVDVSHIKNQIKIANYVSDLYHEYIININENILTLTVGNPHNYETSTSTEITVENGTGVCQSSYAHGYDDIFKSLSGDVSLYINNQKPMMITQMGDNYKAKFLLAPTNS
jgi:hypothetical protein